jgi:hypothetical protein
LILRSCMYGLKPVPFKLTRSRIGLMGALTPQPVKDLRGRSEFKLQGYATLGMLQGVSGWLS